jgi:Domain of unknown function (DUF932)
MKYSNSLMQQNLDNLQQDNVMVDARILPLASLTGYPCSNSRCQGIISNGTLVNVVSKSYGHLDNRSFFANIEEQVSSLGISYKTRAINRNDSSFAVDYIFDQDFVSLLGEDKIYPMLRFTNAYDGSHPTTGSLGYFRQICSNGLMVAESKMTFKAKHTLSIHQVVFPNLKRIFDTFMNNENFIILSKMEKLQKMSIEPKDFVREICHTTKVWQFEASKSNPEPSLNSRLVLETIEQEAELLGGLRPNRWLGYNAFNSIVYGKLKKNFSAQENIDKILFDRILLN